MRPAALVACLIWLAGCASTPTESFHTLSVVEPERQSPVATAPQLAIAIDRIGLPDIVDRPQFVVRVDPNQVRILEQQRWAEPLRAAIPRVIADNVARSLGSALVTAYPRDPPADVRFRVAVDIARFEAQAGQGVTIEALWTVRSVSGGAVLAGRTLAQEPAPSSTQSPAYQSFALAYSRALTTLSRDIAQAVAALAPAGR